MTLAHYNIQHFKYLIYQTIISFILFCVVFVNIGYKEVIPQYKLILQGVFFICYFGIILLTYRINKYKTLLSCIFLYSLILSIILRIIFWEYFNMPFGDAVDSYKYENLTITSLRKGYNTLITNVLNEFDIDDIGYSSIVWIIYSISDYGFGQGIGQILMLILNSIVITLSSWFVYKICILLSVKNKNALISTALYGFFPFFYITASVGLKENFFCFIISFFFYCIYKYKCSYSKWYLLWAFLMVGSAYLFRFAISLILLLILVLSIISTQNNRKSIIVLGIMVVCLFPLIGVMIVESFTGISFEQVLEVAEGRNQRMDSAVSGPFIQIIGALFGPFPNFSRTVQYGILHSAGLLLKSAISIVVLKQIWTTIIKAQWIYYPLTFYYIAGLVMLVIAGVALDMRFAVTFFPVYIILFALALQNKCNWYFINTAQLGIYSIIILYNLR